MMAVMSDPRVMTALKQLNEVEQKYGRAVAERDPNYDLSGEGRARVETLKKALTDLGVKIEWDGRQYRLVGSDGENGG
jgi:hypothetical protein